MLLISIHIPKTAGTTFGAILQNKYKQKFLYVYNSNIQGRYCIGQTLGELGDNQKNEHRFASTKSEIYTKIKELGIECIHGHFYYSWIADAVDYFGDVRYVTWVREPEVRTYSDYLHFMRNGYRGDCEQLIRLLANRMSEFIGPDVSVFSFIGKTESFDDDLKRFEIYDDYSVLNTTPLTIENHEIRSLIKQYVSKDRDLYSRL